MIKWADIHPTTDTATLISGREKIVAIYDRTEQTSKNARYMQGLRDKLFHIDAILKERQSQPRTTSRLKRDIAARKARKAERRAQQEIRAGIAREQAKLDLMAKATASASAELRDAA